MLDPEVKQKFRCLQRQTAMLREAQAHLPETLFDRRMADIRRNWRALENILGRPVEHEEVLA